MESCHLVIFCPDLYVHDKLEINSGGLKHSLTCNSRIRTNKKRWKLLKLDGVFVYYFTKELDLSSVYRWGVLKQFQQWQAPQCIILTETTKDLIDYNWNERINEMARERCEIDHAFSWLSTLGGAFSALGDYFEQCAETAGKISFHQLRLALRIGDPNIQSRCRLYVSLSLIQKKRFQAAAALIRREYSLANSQPVVDHRLVNMCKGIWAKLQYEHSIYIKENRKIKR